LDRHVIVWYGVPTDNPNSALPKQGRVGFSPPAQAPTGSSLQPFAGVGRRTLAGPVARI
jgi:hypothetical protein